MCLLSEPSTAELPADDLALVSDAKKLLGEICSARRAKADRTRP